MDIFDWLMKQFGSAGASAAVDPAAQVQAAVADDPTGRGGSTGAGVALDPASAGPNKNWQGLVDNGMKLAQSLAPQQARGGGGGGMTSAPVHQGQPTSLIDLVFGQRKNQFGGF